MPTYEYLCTNCGYRFDTRQSFKDEALRECPNCHQQTIHRVPQAAGVVFKGSGWYVTDSKAKQTMATSGEKKADSADSSGNGGSESPGTEQAAASAAPASEAKASDGGSSTGTSSGGAGESTAGSKAATEAKPAPVKTA